jgi:hypothetical protein
MVTGQSRGVESEGLRSQHGRRPAYPLAQLPFIWGDRMVAVGGPVGWIQSACHERLTCHLGILRLMTCGLDRRRRIGLSR